MILTNCHTHFSSDFQNEIFQIDVTQPCDVFHSVGIHPWNASAYSVEEVGLLVRNSITNKTLAIGECGLDALKGSSLEIQSKLFIEQIKLSEELALPLIIHCVKAWNELHAIRLKYRPKQPWVFHGMMKA